jgi:prevent-host-death family protein
MKIVNVHRAKTHLSRFLDEVRAGAEIVLAKKGVPYAKLVPFSRGTKRPLGFVEINVQIPDSAFFDPLPDDVLALFEGQTVPVSRRKISRTQK